MTKLYVANCSQQNQSVNYRLIESVGVKQQTIEIGQQIILGGRDITDIQIDGIIEQLDPYGFFRADTIGKQHHYAGLVYSLDKPVSLDLMSRVIERNREILIHKGREIRQQAAVAVNNSLDENTGSAPDMLEMSVQEEKRGTGGDSSTDPLSEGVRVTKHADRGNDAPRRGRPPKVR